jgi:hypothetical protein
MLSAFLDHQQSTLAWTCEGVGSEGLGATVGPSTMTLGGLLKHMALLEDSWFTRWLHGRDIGAPWNTVDWDADYDWDWNFGRGRHARELLTMWQDAVEHSRAGGWGGAGLRRSGSAR